MRSATVPETMEAAVATNTTWKYQSEAAAYAVLSKSPPSAAASSADQNGLNEPITLPTSVYIKS